jgi:hypothetical protein
MYTPENIKQMWLSNFVIDIALGVMRETYCEFKNKIKILSCDVSGHLNNYPSKKISNLKTSCSKGEFNCNAITCKWKSLGNYVCGLWKS